MLVTAVLVAFATSTGGVAPAATPGGSGWNATAASYRGQNGTQYTYDCPKYGTAYSVWGTDVYTDDSSVCTAGVHAGVITLAGGGQVTIEIRPGEAAYTGSTRNRITSNSYPAWSGSYIVVGGVAAQPSTGSAGSGWDKNAAAYRTWVGAQFQYDCPRGGPVRTVWGTDVYTDDSSVCTAAVHAGLITVKNGGKVTIEMLEGQASYKSTTRHGIKSNPYGTWGGSFLVVGAPGGPEDPQGTATGEVFVNGRRFTSGKVKYGSTVDVTKGTLQLTATGVGSVTTTGDGTDLARFVLKKSVEKESGKRRITAEMALTGGDFNATCAAGARAGAHAAANSKTVRALWANGKGRFRTKGRFASATVRGTNWQTFDRCDGTLTVVKQGAILVRDFTRKKNVVVKAGKQYLAPAKR